MLNLLSIHLHIAMLSSQFDEPREEHTHSEISFLRRISILASLMVGYAVYRFFTGL